MLGHRQQQNLTISNLQSYITQLTLYINQNNKKYTTNLQLLKQFYQPQITNLQQSISIIQSQNLSLKNQLLIIKDILINKEKQLKDQKVKSNQLRIQQEDTRDRLIKERQKIDQLYDQMQHTKLSFKQALDNQQQQVKQIDHSRNQLVLQLKDKQQQINNLKKEQSRLQDQLSDRYSLPQKIKDLQLESVKNKTLVTSLSEAKRQLQKKLDFSVNQIQGLKRQRTRLEIIQKTYQSSSKLELQQCLKKQSASHQQIQSRLQMANQSHQFQITQLQNSIKCLKRQNNQLQKKLSQYQQENKIIKARVLSYDSEKDKYIQEFRKLKTQYQQVIKGLQQTIPIYQKKNFQLQQENQDLNTQLDGLRDLLNQLKAMNTLQPLKAQYRQIAQLQLLANRNYTSYKRQQQSNNQYKDKVNQISRDSMFMYQINANNKQNPIDQNEFKWDKLLAQIDNIQI